MTPMTIYCWKKMSCLKTELYTHINDKLQCQYCQANKQNMTHIKPTFTVPQFKLVYDDEIRDQCNIQL